MARSICYHQAPMTMVSINKDIKAERRPRTRAGQILSSSLGSRVRNNLKLRGRKSPSCPLLESQHLARPQAASRAACHVLFNVPFALVIEVSDISALDPSLLADKEVITSHNFSLPLFPLMLFSFWLCLWFPLLPPGTNQAQGRQNPQRGGH